MFEIADLDLEKYFMGIEYDKSTEIYTINQRLIETDLSTS